MTECETVTGQDGPIDLRAIDSDQSVVKICFLFYLHTWLKTDLMVSQKEVKTPQSAGGK